MNWLSRLEKHLGFLAVPNLILGVIIGQAVMTVAALQDPTLPLQLYLDPMAVSAGQWWRLFTWVIVPSTSALGVLFAVFWFWFLWIVGRTLEQEWGEFRCTLYLILGVALPAAGSMLLLHYFGLPVIQTGLYFSLSLQLAFAAIAPEFTLYFFFVLPVKMRWWAWAIGAWLLYRSVTGGAAGALEVLFGVGNYLIFFLPLAFGAARQRKEVQANRKVFKEASREAAAIQAHRCEQCGADRSANLRLCTCERCGEDGKFWCEEHLQPHLTPTPVSSPKHPHSPSPSPPRRGGGGPARTRMSAKSGVGERSKTKRKG